MCSSRGILFMFHCRPNIGYAIKSLEQAFCRASLRIFSPENVYVAYKPSSLVSVNWFECGTEKKVLHFDLGNSAKKDFIKIKQYVRKHNIDTVVCFDLGPEKKLYKYLRAGGVQKIISYWGAPISGLKNYFTLMIKKIEVMLYRYQPDLYIFESHAMADTALRGRGIAENRIKVVNLGVDTDRFSPVLLSKDRFYAHEIFKIPKEQKIVFYSGHMEERKGVAIIMRAAVELVQNLKYQNVHFLLLGNQQGEEREFLKLLVNHKVEKNVTFGGYRDDVAALHKSCSVGVIASTGWDSFTMSAVEMAASGLPLIVSKLQGLREVIVEGKTGFFIKPGDYVNLAKKILLLLEDDHLRKTMAVNARSHALQNFSKEKQVKSLAELFG